MLLRQAAATRGKTIAKRADVRGVSERPGEDGTGPTSSKVRAARARRLTRPVLPCLETTVFDALDKPLSAIALDVTRALARVRPGLMAVAVERELDVEHFARAGRCTLTHLPNTPSHTRWYPNERSTALLPWCVQGWRKVEWDGHVLELVTLSWGHDSCLETFSWVLAASAPLAHRFILEVWNFDDLDGGVLVFENGAFARSAVMADAIAAVTLGDVVLPGTLGEEIRGDVLRFFGRRGFYEEHRLPWKRGLLFVGPPGNGKTQTIKALLRECEQPVLYVKSFHSRSGTEDNIRRVFARARKVAPCVLVLEDLDCLVDDHCRSVFLNELDGFAQNTGILVIATTNHPEKLDRSILDRPSRFDRKFHFPLPGDVERRAYLEKWNAGQVPAMQLSAPGLDRVVQRSKGFTFAYLKELMLSAALRWADDSAPGAMDRLAADSARELTEQMASTAVLLGPIERRAAIGFADASR